MLLRFLTFFCLFAFSVSSLKAQPIERQYPELAKAQYVFLIDQDTKEVLFEKNADDRVYPSSMTKIMTAYVIFDQLKKGKLKLSSECLIGKAAWRKPGSKMFLNYGDVVTIEQLIGGLLAVSGNDAAVALAEVAGGSIENFAAMMNDSAEKIGLKNSHFKNPHGLYEEGHYMSLRDLGTLAIKVLEDFPEYSHFFSISEFTYANVTQLNRNPLIKGKYEGATGMKTGHTNQGGYGVVGTATRGSRRLVAVTNEAKTPKQRVKIITELLDHGFNDYKKVVFFDKNSSVANVKTWLGNKDEVAVASNGEVAITLPKDQSIDDLKVKVEYKGPVYTPIASGSKVATLVIEASGKKLREVSLFAKENVDKAGYFQRIWKITKYKCYQFIKEIA